MGTPLDPRTPSCELLCSSHPPHLLIRPREPREEQGIVRLREALAAGIERFDPERIILFGNDHFAGFHYALMPPYCIGLEARAVADLGGFAGALDVPQDDAKSLLVSLREQGFDPAVSYRMTVDHAFSQPLTLYTGALDRYPVVPVFVSVFTPPFIPFARSRLLGEAVARWVAASGKRTLLMGTGGLSHHPVKIFPLMDQASPEVLAYQMQGAREGSMSDEAWLQRFSDLHLDGAEMLGSGQRTAADLRIDADLDREVLDLLCRGDLRALDAVPADALIARGGIGMLEIHAWIAATAAFQALRPGAAVRSHYAPVIEYGTGFGQLFSATLDPATTTTDSPS